jgi:hypothetical protein
MNPHRTARIGTAALAITACLSSALSAQQGVDWKPVEAAIGRAGVAQAGDVHRFNFPRSDMRVIATGVDMRPAFALGGWIAMKAAPGGVVAMGDLVLKEAEVGPVMSRLLQGGISATAVHHHVLHELPRVMYMHVHGHGNPVRLAETIRAAVALTTIPPPSPPAAAATSPLGIDTVAITRVLGHGGRANGGVWQVSVPRAEVIRDGAFEIPPTMGLGTAINFQPTGGGTAAITGDFVMIASEVTAVTQALRDNGIEVTALHNHMLTEEPRLFFMHFWAVDDAVKLARGLRAALDRTNSRRPAP